MQSDQERLAKEQAKMEQVALSFQKAMKGIGTDEERIIREIVAYNTIQRQLIKTKYLMITGNEIMDDFKSELSGYFLETVLGLFTPIEEYEATILHEAIKGLGTNEEKVIEILCSKDSTEIKNLQKGYKRVYRRELEADIKYEETGYLGRIFRSLASGARNENHGYDQEFVKKETENLYDAGQGKTGTNEKEFIRILCSRSFPELNAIFAIYNEKYGKDIQEVIKSEFSGEVRDALLTIVKCARNKAAYFAELLYRSMVGQGTNEKELLQVIVRRSDIDLQAVKIEFQKMYRSSLYEAVKSEISGDFEKLILALIGKK